MTDSSEPTEDNKPKSNKALFLISFVVALICAGGGFYASSAGIIAFGKRTTPRRVITGSSFGILIGFSDIYFKFV